MKTNIAIYFLWGYKKKIFFLILQMSKIFTDFIKISFFSLFFSFEKKRKKRRVVTYGGTPELPHNYVVYCQNFTLFGPKVCKLCYILYDLSCMTHNVHCLYLLGRMCDSLKDFSMCMCRSLPMTIFRSARLISPGCADIVPMSRSFVFFCLKYVCHFRLGFRQVFLHWEKFLLFIQKFSVFFLFLGTPLFY